MIASPPDVKVTVGILIDSLAVNVKEIVSPAFAFVVVELSEAMATLDRVGAVVSTAGKIAISSMKIVPALTPTLPFTACTLSVMSS